MSALLALLLLAAPAEPKKTVLARNVGVAHIAVHDGQLYGLLPASSADDDGQLSRVAVSGGEPQLCLRDLSEVSLAIGFWGDSEVLATTSPSSAFVAGACKGQRGRELLRRSGRIEAAAFAGRRAYWWESGHLYTATLPALADVHPLATSRVPRLSGPIFLVARPEEIFVIARNTDRRGTDEREVWRVDLSGNWRLMTQSRGGSQWVAPWGNDRALFWFRGVQPGRWELVMLPLDDAPPEVFGGFAGNPGEVVADANAVYWTRFEPPEAGKPPQTSLWRMKLSARTPELWLREPGGSHLALDDEAVYVGGDSLVRVDR